MSENHPGTIITFYSYKGGTGRTMALANTACLLAKRLHAEKKPDGKPPTVLAIDWDFEAPGLHHYFKDRLLPAAQTRFDDAPGCIDLFDQLKASSSEYSPKDFVGNRNRARAALATLGIESYLLETTIPGLSIIKSGRHDKEYPKRVSQFDWSGFFQATFGLFNGFSDFLRERFDYVLVDSRTGVTDTSGICTMVLPDKLVAVFTLNRQSLTGLEDLTTKAVAYRQGSPDERALTVFPLPSRIETARPQMFDAWRKGAAVADNMIPGQTQDIPGYQPLFEKLFRDCHKLESLDMTEYFNEVQIQHIPDYAYGEPIAVELETDSRISLRRSYEAFVDRLVELDTPWQSLRETRQARDILRRCIEIDEKISNNRIDEALRMAWGLYETRLGDKTFEKTTETVLKVAQAGYPQHRQEVSKLVHNGAEIALSGYDLDISYLADWGIEVGELCLEFGDYQNALWLFEQIRAKLQESLGAEHPAVFSALKGLGRTQKALGRFAEARSIQEQILESHRQLFGEEHPETLSVMNNLAETLRAQGDLAEAEGVAEKSLESCIRALGEEHPETLTSKNNLAEILLAQGDLDKAKEQVEKALELRCRVLGEQHPGTLSSMNILAEILLAQGYVSEARKQQEIVLELRCRILGEEHPDSIVSMNNLAEILRAQGDLGGAKTLNEKSLGLCRRTLGDEHPDTMFIMNNLALTLAAMGDHSGARALQEMSSELSRRTLGEEHPSTLTLMNNLASTLAEQGDLNGARNLQERVLRLRQKILGKAHPETLTSMNNLAVTLGNQGDLAGARILHEEVLDLQRHKLGETHPDTLNSMNNLAATLRDQGDLAAARSLQEKTLELRKLKLGEEHPATLNTMDQLALTLWRQGELAGARSLQENSLAIKRRVLGNDHPDTRMTMKDLAETLKTMGETERALELFSEAAKTLSNSATPPRSSP